MTRQSPVHRSCASGEQGFSLLETIIALVILAMALTTLFEAYGSGIRAISAGNRHAEARLLAQSLLAQVSDPAKPQDKRGNERGLSWNLTVKPATGELAGNSPKAKWRLLEAVATVSWAPGRKIVLRTLRVGAKK